MDGFKGIRCPLLEKTSMCQWSVTHGYIIWVRHVVFRSRTVALLCIVWCRTLSGASHALRKCVVSTAGSPRVPPTPGQHWEDTESSACDRRKYDGRGRSDCWIEIEMRWRRRFWGCAVCERKASQTYTIDIHGKRSVCYIWLHLVNVATFLVFWFEPVKTKWI